MKLYVVDATYELFRGYFAIKSMKAPDGRAVNGVYGLMQTMISLLGSGDVTHIGCATDTTIRSWRNDLYDGYKTGDGLPEDLFSQFPLAEKGLETLGMRVWRMVDFEADDAVATAAHRFAPVCEEVILCSPDKDFAQCVRGEHVIMWDRRREKFYDEAGVLEKWGVAPASIPSWLALVGDAADGLPGIPRWGAKSTAQVLRTYGTVAEIPSDFGQWSIKVRGGATLSANLEAQREDALLFERLATLSLDADQVDQDIEALRWGGIDHDAFVDFCDDLGFDGIKNRGLALTGG